MPPKPNKNPPSSLTLLRGTSIPILFHEHLLSSIRAVLHQDPLHGPAAVTDALATCRAEAPQAAQDPAPQPRQLRSQSRALSADVSQAGSPAPPPSRAARAGSSSSRFVGSGGDEERRCSGPETTPRVAVSKLAGSPNTYIAALQRDVIGLLTAKGEMEAAMEGLRGAVEELKVDMGVEFQKVRFEIEYGACMCGKFTPPPWMVGGVVGGEAGAEDGGTEHVQGTEDGAEVARDSAGYETGSFIMCGKRE